MLNSFFFFEEVHTSCLDKYSHSAEQIHYKMSYTASGVKFSVSKKTYLYYTVYCKLIILKGMKSMLRQQVTLSAGTSKTVGPRPDSKFILY